MCASPMLFCLCCVFCSSAKLRWTWKNWGCLQGITIPQPQKPPVLFLHAGARREPGFPTETQITTGCCGWGLECALWSDWPLWAVLCWQPWCCCAKGPANWMPPLGKMGRAKGNSISEISLMSQNLTYPLYHPGTSVLGKGWVEGRR